MNIVMKQYRKIYHSPLEVKGKTTGYYLLITEVCMETDSILALYVYPMPAWTKEWNFEEYEFYKPIFN